MDKLALFQEGIGQTTNFLKPLEALSFPTDSKRHYWYQDEKGNRYSFYEAMVKFNK
jgi:hypothetical protein